MMKPFADTINCVFKSFFLEYASILLILYFGVFCSISFKAIYFDKMVVRFIKWFGWLYFSSSILLFQSSRKMAFPLKASLISLSPNFERAKTILYSYPSEKSGFLYSVKLQMSPQEISAYSPIPSKHNLHDFLISRPKIFIQLLW